MVSKLLFLGGLAAVFRGLLTSSRLTTHRPLFALCTTQPRHCTPIGCLCDSCFLLFCANLEPPCFLHPLGPLNPKNVFKECPCPPLTPSRLLYTHYPLTYLLTLLNLVGSHLNVLIYHLLASLKLYIIMH
jgi:hypothetical protein